MDFYAHYHYFLFIRHVISDPFVIPSRIVRRHFCTTAATVQIPNYVANLFPNLGAQDVAAAAQLYQGLGSNIEQANLIVGECEFVPQLIRGLKPRISLFVAILVCPTHYLLKAFSGRCSRCLTFIFEEDPPQTKFFEHRANSPSLLHFTRLTFPTTSLRTSTIFPKISHPSTQIFVQPGSSPPEHPSTLTSKLRRIPQLCLEPRPER
jgi:hypothetical protein